MIKSICVYCSSSNVLEESYKEAAGDFAEAASSLGLKVICGGSSRGLMGIIIDRMIQKGGRVEGVMPLFMKELELNHPVLESIIYVNTLSERKEKLRETSDAVVAMPGGLGTLEEFLETFTLKRLGLYDGETILLNINGFYNGLISLFEQYERERFLGKNWRYNLKVAESVPELMDIIRNSTPGRQNPGDYFP
ncbi:MAG: TIGR00730 family Rossman fold protein [Bacteroidales bacterium]|nr:TIGR00730 family Rossman fold protein [Bacteroidales bacterium]MDD2424455.1 TIGR00730 family Rossman fold protein [Bacteroidales bacterium]MDD3989828.1 TIGR00730 family Rossman fold protein [Bacteroidales bacterium]